MNGELIYWDTKKYMKSTDSKKILKTNSKKKKNKVTQLNYIIVVGVVLAVTFFSYRYYRDAQILQKYSTYQFEEISVPEPVSINLVTAGNKLPKSDDPEVNAMIAYNQAKLQNKSEIEARKAAKLATEESLAVLKTNPTTTSLYTAIVAETKAANPGMTVVTDKAIAEVVSTETSTFMQDAVVYEKVDGVVKAKNIVKFDANTKLTTNFTAGNIPYCDLENGMGMSVGTVVKEGNVCKQCVPKTSSGSTTGVTVRVRCSTVPAQAIVGVTNTNSGQTVSDDCLVYRAPDGVLSINAPDNSVGIYVPNSLVKKSNKRNTDLPIYTFRESGTNVLRYCNNGKWETIKKINR